MPIPFDNTYAQLPARFFSPQTPARAPNPTLIRLNHALAAELSIDAEWLASAEGAETFAGNTVPEGAQPIAQAYAGHQFGNFVPQLGDGRAILLGEARDREGRRRDIQLKGSGCTAYSRGGDGKSALGPVLREYIVSEAMTALGVPSTRALAAVATGETVLRQDGPLPGAVFTRVAASHIRVGTFQYFLARDDTEALRELANYAIARHYPSAALSDQPFLALLEAVLVAQADLIAQWMSFGFIHGVMNTDNTAISGETIDYGPCAFMDAFHPDRVFSSIDRNGRYAWANQPHIGLWNLTRFAETLLPLLAPETEKAIEIAETALSKFTDRFATQYAGRFSAKLGILPDAGGKLIQACLDLLADQSIDFTLFFRHLTCIAAGDTDETLIALFSEPSTIEKWMSDWRQRFDPPTGLVAMQAANPVLIPRNHRIEQAIQSAQKGDYTLFHRLVDALATPYSDNTENADLERPPLPAEIVHETFCGT